MQTVLDADRTIDYMLCIYYLSYPFYTNTKKMKSFCAIKMGQMRLSNLPLGTSLRKSALHTSCDAKHYVPYGIGGCETVRRRFS